MDYELAKKLKEARFPQESVDWYFAQSKKDKWELYSGGETPLEMPWYKSPSLPELIEACGEKFENLTLEDGKWQCNYWIDQEGGAEFRDSEGSTPEEAVALLWLSLQGK
jgi:hypothetical protein